MKTRILALCAASAVLFPTGLTGSGDDFAAAGHHKHRKVNSARCRKQPTVVERNVSLILVGTDMRFGFVDGVLVPTQVFADVLDPLGNPVGVYEEQWDPIFDEAGNHVGMNGVALFTFDGADPTLNGTLSASNVSQFLGFDETGFFLLIQTAGQITGATGDLAGTTGDVAMASTALLFDNLFYFDSQVTLSLQSAGDGDGRPGKRMCRRRFPVLPSKAKPRWMR